MQKVRWGILSTAKIGVKKVIPAMQRAEHCEIVAISSRDAGRARAVADSLQIPKAYGSYESLLADPDVEAIYNPLPNHMHVAWSIRALEAGKHVLCEKPIGLNSNEGQQLVDAGKHYPHLKLMEAFMYRHHPQWRLARQLVEEGRIGALRTVHSFFSYFIDDPANLCNSLEYGGGGLMDIGCYPISLSRFLFRKEPERVLGLIERDPRFRTDRLTSALLDFGTGTATFTCGTQLADFQRVNIYGTEGRVEIEIPFNAPPDVPCRIWHQTGAETREILLDVCDQYEIQGNLFSLAIKNNTPVPTPIEDAVANMHAIEAIVASARDGRWKVPVST